MPAVSNSSQGVTTQTNQRWLNLSTTCSGSGKEEEEEEEGSGDAAHVLELKSTAKTSRGMTEVQDATSDLVRRITMALMRWTPLILGR